MKKLIKGLIGKIKKLFTISKDKRIVRKILKAVSQETGITVKEITEKSRKRYNVQPRQVVMYLVRNNTKLTFESIGKLIGGWSHSTVIYSCNTISNLIDSDRQVREMVKRINSNLERF